MKCSDTISWKLSPVSLKVKHVYSLSWTALKNLIIQHYISLDLLVEMCFRKPGGFHSTHTLLIVELNTYFMIRRLKPLARLCSALTGI